MPMQENHTSPTKHIAVLAFPFGTHAAPLLSLVRRLSAAAPHLIFSFFSTEHSNSLIFPKNEELPNIRAYSVFDGLPEWFDSKGNPHEVLIHFLKAMPGNFRSSMEGAMEMIGRPFDGIVTDAFLWFGFHFAEEFCIPWVPVWTAGPRALLVHCDTVDLRRQLGINAPADKSLDFLPDFSRIHVEDLPDGIITGDVDSHFSVMLYKMGRTLPKATAVVANSYEDLDSTVVNMLKSRFQKFLNIGPLFLTSPPSNADPHGCLEWLNARAPASVAYISFGSYVTPPLQELAALAAALEETGTPYLWSFRGNPEQNLPEGFLERTTHQGKLVPWAPQLEILQHESIGVFVTHCGWNSILESIVGGVPMICRSFFGDQRLNMRTLETIWGIGVGAKSEGFTKEWMIGALELVILSSEREKMKEKLEVQRRLAFKAMEQEGGSSTQNFRTLLNLFPN